MAYLLFRMIGLTVAALCIATLLTLWLALWVLAAVVTGVCMLIGSRFRPTRHLPQPPLPGRATSPAQYSDRR